MGKREYQRSENNETAEKLVQLSRSRPLTVEELGTLRASFTGSGGLVPSRFDGGQYFTPKVVVDFIVAFLRVKGGDVLEPSCGGGAFIGALPPACRVTGLELNLQTAEVAQLLCPSASILPGDALTQLGSLRETFDYCIGNPPFVDLPRGAYHEGFTFATGQRDATWFFIELGMQALLPGGWLAMVVPDGILANSSCQKQRQALLTQYWLRAVISLPRETFLHAGTSAKTSILVLQKPDRPFKANDLDYGIFMAVAEQIGWDSRLRPTGKCDLPEVLAEWGKFPKQVMLTPAASLKGQQTFFFDPSNGEPATLSPLRV
jgi:type I restriction-modification system DNA methylase subunit